MNNNKVWYVTGASKGLGLALVQKLLADGYRVAATSRSKEGLIQSVGIEDTARFLPLETDLASPASIAASIRETHAHFNGLDVIVNNAGYGIGGTVEELGKEDISQSFDINVFATIHVMQAAMPYLRRQRSGRIINIASIAGFAPATGWAVYAATKFAIMGLTEVMAQDVKEFGVYATVVAPGGFRTEFLKQESLVMAEPVTEGYQAVRQSHGRYAALDGHQKGDPAKAADVFIRLAEMPEPPVTFFMGSDAYGRAKDRIAQLATELEANRAWSFATDYETTGA